MLKIITRLVVASFAAVLMLGPATASASPTATAVVTVVEEVAMPAWDTLENRTGGGAVIGAVLGGLAGLPFFGIGAIPGAIIGALIGAGIGNASWHIANQYVG